MRTKLFSVRSCKIDIFNQIKKKVFIITLFSVMIRTAMETARKGFANSFCDENAFAMNKIKKSKIEKVG